MIISLLLARRERIVAFSHHQQRIRQLTLEHWVLDHLDMGSMCVIVT